MYRKLSMERESEGMMAMMMMMMLRQVVEDGT